ncbi:MAG: lactate utilization protein [Deltaproteobacteria bacterium]|nr:lactate utilization protein [Deltaproteobacteria bacterium]
MSDLKDRWEGASPEKIKKWYYQKIGENVKDALRKNFFDAYYFEKREDAIKFILDKIKPEASVGMGGSVTLRELNLDELIKQKVSKVYDHWPETLSAEEKKRIRKAQLLCDIFLTSSNAITMNGELVNIDGIGNRVGALNFGPGEVIVVAGINKVVNDRDAAIYRIKNVVAPMNAKRLGYDVPCAKLGRCVDCDTQQRICRSLLILERSPRASNITVVLIGEELGF